MTSVEEAGCHLVRRGFTLGYAVLATGHHPRRSPLEMAWTAITALVMLALAAGKARTGAALNNPVLRTEGRVTFIDGILAARSWPASSPTLGRDGGERIPWPATPWSITPSVKRAPSSRTGTEPRRAP